MKNRKNKLLIAAFVFAAFSSSGQDYSFSQFYTLPLLRNPALSGVFTGHVRCQSVYRNQWQSVTVPFRTSALSAEYKLPSENFTLGMQATHDVAGDSKLKRIQFFPSVSGHVYLSDKAMVTGGFAAGVVTSQFDPTALKWDDQFVNGQYSAANPTSQVIKNTTRNYFDAAAGISLITSIEDKGMWWYIGGAVFHAAKPRIDFFNNESFRLNRKWIINSGLTTATASGGELSLYADYLMQGGHRQFLLGSYYTFMLVPSEDSYEDMTKITLSLGGLYRWNDAFIPVIKLNWYEWNIGLSYDINISKLRTASQARGGFEITLGFRDFLKGRENIYKPRVCSNGIDVNF